MADEKKKIEELLHEAFLLPSAIREKALAALKNRKMSGVKLKEVIVILESFVEKQNKTITDLINKNPEVYKRLAEEYAGTKKRMNLLLIENNKQADKKKLAVIQSLIHKM